MEKKVYVELLGHKAEVVSIKGRLGDLITKQDYLAVWLDFGEAVGSTIAFGIRLPIRDYGKDELLQEIKGFGEARLKEILDEDARGQAESWARGKRQEELDSLAGQLQSMITK